MMNPISVSIGQVALPTSLVVGIVSIGIAAAVGHWAGRTHRSSVGAVLLDMLLAGAVAARVGFVVTWFAQYRADPWSVVDIRDGGFLLWAGLVAAALVALWQGWRRPTLRKPLALGLVAGAMGWLAAPGALRFGVDPTVTSWGLSVIGWVLVLLPFALLGVGYLLSRLRTSVNAELLRDVLS